MSVAKENKSFSDLHNFCFSNFSLLFQQTFSLPKLTSAESNEKINEAKIMQNTILIMNEL